MYETFYGLKEKPFTLLPDPDYLYLSPKHQRALTLLEYGMMNQASFSVICGDTGAGKTTLIRRLLSEMGDDTRVGLITNTHQSFGELLNWVLMAFGLDGEGMSKAQMHQIFIEFLIKQYAQNKRVVLIVDEAQNMSADTLEELRMLSNINADKDQVLQVILAGQPALRETLRQPELMQFAQRIAVDYYLEALSAEETRNYIHHRLKVAGAENNIFTDAACDAIYSYSQGTPRLINLLSDTALVYGFAEQTPQIDEKLVHDVVREQHSNSIIPTFKTSQPHATDNMPLKQKSAAQQPEQAEQLNKPQVKAEPTAEQDVEDEAIARLAQRAVQAVSNADQTAVVNNAPLQSVVASAKSAGNSAGMAAAGPDGAETGSGEAQLQTEEPLDGSMDSPVDSPGDSNEPPGESSKVTPISGRSQEQASETSGEPSEEAEETAAHKDQPAGEDSDKLDSGLPDEHDAGSQDFGHTSGAGQHFADDDSYPIVHIEENPKKGINMMLLGLVGGLFIASVIMMGLAWMMFNSGELKVPVATQSAPAGSSDLEREAEKRKMQALQKERDAALAVSRALELERDAALKAAKAQEKIRQAELRAAEILAEQERKAELRLQRARAKAREAERAEALARERERKLRIEAEKKAAELEAQRLKVLQEERQRLRAQAEKEAEAQRLREAREAQRLKDVRPVYQKPVEKVETKPVKEKSFSANPCNTPSAKFLSTCKK